MTGTAARADAGPTSKLVSFIQGLRWDKLSRDVQHEAKRHLLDTIGVMIAGSASPLTSQAEAVLSAVRPAGTVPVPGRVRRADILDAAFLAGIAGHGIELDDGYRQGSVHPGACVVPAALYGGYQQRTSGIHLLTSIVAGYEVMTALGASAHPALRQRGFHPTAVLGVFGAAAAAGYIHRLDAHHQRPAQGRRDLSPHR